MVQCAPHGSENTKSSRLVLDYITDVIVSHSESGGDIYVSPDSRYVILIDNEGNSVTVSSVADSGTYSRFHDGSKDIYLMHPL